MKKIVFWAVVIFVLFFVFTNPHGAAAPIRGVLDLLKNAANSVQSFLTSL
jgi:hypothetical protein